MFRSKQMLCEHNLIPNKLKLGFRKEKLCNSNRGKRMFQKYKLKDIIYAPYDKNAPEVVKYIILDLQRFRTCPVKISSIFLFLVQ